MPVVVVLAVGVDSSLLVNQRLVLQSAGCYFIPADPRCDRPTQGGRFRSSSPGPFPSHRKQRTTDVLDSSFRIAHTGGLRQGVF